MTTIASHPSAFEVTRSLMCILSQLRKWTAKSNSCRNQILDLNFCLM